MIKNYIKIAFRNLIKSKGYTATNILGLATGIAAILLIVLFVKDELSYDKYNNKADRIYRVAVDGLYGDTEIKWIATCSPLAAASKKEFPEIEDAVRIGDCHKPIITNNLKSFSEFSVLTTDSNIFNIFTFPVVQGISETALNLPNSIVITESTAKKIFGNENPIDKTLKAFEKNLRITAVIKDVPKNSHIQFDMLVSSSSFEIFKSTDWWDNNISTYFLLKENTKYKALEAKLPEMQKKYMSTNGESFEKWISRGNKWQFYLQPLNKIHLTTNADGITVANNNMVYVYIFSIVAFFILLLACVNYTNLTTAKASLRYKESGIRRVIGSKRASIISQFLTESIIITFFAALIGLLIVGVTIPWFNQLTDKALKISYFFSWYSIPVLLVFIILISFLAGIFPAYQMSTCKTLDLLKGKKDKATVHFGLREVLIVFQFFISIGLIVSTIFVYKQLNFIQNNKLGFDKANVIVIQRANELQQKIKTFKEDIQLNPKIINSTASNSAPGYTFSIDACLPEGFETKKTTAALIKYCTDFDFPITYGMETSKGRFFSKEFPTDSSGILINESAAKLFNWKDPIGKKVFFGGNKTYTVIGVLKDYHYESMQNEILPACIVPFNHYNEEVRIISVKVNNIDIPKTIEFLKSTWDKYSNGIPFQYSFLDEDYEKLYEKEKRISKTLTLFSILAIFLACIGLFGLAIFIANRKTKEIGIRKINGANTAEILAMLNKNFVKWVVIAYIIACPLAWFVIHKWLENFAYKTDLSWWVFALAGLLTLVVALITVSWQSWKAARRNPVESLHYE
jgi:putative ABC transport system permease protein